MKLNLREKDQNFLITLAFLAPLLASPLYFTLFLGWAMSDGHSPTPFMDLLLYWIVPFVSLFLLLFVFLFSKLTSRKIIAVVLAAVPNLIELAFVFKLWKAG